MQLQAWVSKSAAMTLSGCAHLQLYFPACRGLCGVSVIDAGRPRLPCLTQSLQLNSWHGGAAAQCDHVHSLQHSIPLQRCTGLQQLQPTSLGAPGRPVPARRPAWTCAPSCPARTLMLSFTTPRLACKALFGSASAQCMQQLRSQQCPRWLPGTQYSHTMPCCSTWQRTTLSGESKMGMLCDILR